MPRAPNDPYRELFERSADAILIIEGETFVDCNQAAVKMLRYGSKEEVLRAHPSQLSPPTQPDGRPSFEKANEMIARAFADGSHRFEWEHRRADGEVFPVEVLLTAVPRRDGSQVLHTVWRDITDRKRLEEQLRQSQKMEAIGKLAGGIAHDFNNLLVGILGYADLLHERLLVPADVDAVEQILRAGERAAELVRQLMAFSRKQERRPVVVDLGAALSDLERLLSRIIGEHVDLQLVRPEPPARVRIDPNQLEQVVVNLVANARDAMPDGGTLTLRVRRSGAPPEPLAPGAYAVLEVTDTGPGMDPAVRARAFEPFFTTKPEGEGTGLGLATVYAIARQAGGVADIDSSPAGTTVRVFLRETEVPPAEVPQRAALDATGGDETILLVEDEAAVASLVQEVLTLRGYQVLLARDGVEALSVFEAHEGIDLVLTDVVMPRMGGPAFVAALGERGHTPRVLYMSGYTADRLSGLPDDEVDLLVKPFTGPQLLGRVRQALDGSAAVEGGEVPRRLG